MDITGPSMTTGPKKKKCTDLIKMHISVMVNISDSRPQAPSSQNQKVPSSFTLN